MLNTEYTLSGEELISPKTKDSLSSLTFATPEKDETRLPKTALEGHAYPLSSPTHLNQAKIGSEYPKVPLRRYKMTPPALSTILNSGTCLTR